MFGFDKIPDNTNKIYILLSILAFYFIGKSLIDDIQKLDAQFNILSEKVNDNKDSMLESSSNLMKLKKTSEYLSLKYRIDNPITSTDSTAFLYLKNDTNKNYLFVVEKILPLYLDYRSSETKDKVQKLTFKSAAESQQRNINILSGKITFYGIMTIMILYIFLSSIASIRKKEQELEHLEKYNIREKGKLTEYCQSCGRNFDSMVNVSKNLDETYNYSFCSECFSKGMFIKNYDDVVELVISNETIAENEKQIHIDGLKKLDRWNNNRYPKEKK